MQVTETSSEGLKREFKIVVPAADIQAQLMARLGELSHTVRLPGFRPGKVPVPLLKKKFGGQVMGEVLERTVNETTQRTMSERNLRLAMQPQIKIEKFAEGGDLEYAMSVELFPEFTPVDPKTLSLERMKVAVEDSHLAETLDRMAKAYQGSQPVEGARKAKKGDIVVIDFVGKIDGKEFSGGKADGYHLELGSNMFIPGFEEQLEGTKAGDAVTVKVAFPESYGAAALAGKDAEFEVTVKELREPTPAALDDELAKKVGFESLDKLKDTLREEKEKEFQSVARLRLKRALFDQLVEKHDFPLPSGMVEAEFTTIWNHFEETRKTNPDVVDDEDKGKTDDELKVEYRTLAERRVRLALLIGEVGRLNDIQIGQEELNRALMNEMRRYPGQEKMVMDYFRGNPQAMETLRGPIYEDKVVDFILELAQVAERSVGYDELMEDPDLAKAKTKKKTAAKKSAKKAKDAE